MGSFTHSGSTGDTFSSLAAVRCLGGGDYYLRLNNMDNICASLGWGNAGRHSGRMRKGDFDFLAPIMEIQSCITKFEIWDGRTVDYELEQCAYHMRDNIWPANFANWYAQAMKLDLEKNKRILQIDPYVDVDKPTSISGRPVCISRNPHHLDGTPDLAKVEEWINWFDRGLAEQCFFVGLPEEHAWFEDLMKVKVHYEPTSDGLALARLIAGAKMMIGNQSMPATLALGIGTTLWIEVRKRTPLEQNEILYPFRSNINYF
jgi:hypothetical protein